MTPEKLCETLAKFAASQGIELNRDREFTLDILKGLLRNEERYGYRSCPCRLASGRKEQDRDIICPCVYRDADITEFGSCYCSLYVSPAWNEGAVEHVLVPERRLI
ncbi:MAG TPA: ferredoxin-thioredoxin reductase catalytic domain-containing protein [Dissulfurispiraceae bacterium]|nr:ferredoxin-thioredoxin reductase catalytic domain-containing protein [Dissulfurispiraceae bacterium]